MCLANRRAALQLPEHGMRDDRFNTPPGWALEYLDGLVLLVPRRLKRRSDQQQRDTPHSDRPTEAGSSSPRDDHACRSTQNTARAAHCSNGNESEHSDLPQAQLEPPSKPDFSAFDASLELDAAWAAAEQAPQRDAILAVVQEPDAWREHVQIFSPSVRKALADDPEGLLPDAAREDIRRIERIVKRILEREDFPGFSGWRRVVRATAALDRAVSQLGEEFPNFGPVTEFVRERIALAARRDGRLTLGPILLNGPPGIGKTEFVRHLSSAMSAPLLFIDMASAQTNSTLAGSETFWANSSSGELFRTIVDGEWASPVVVLDELDKVGSDLPYDPIAPLYRLLEPSSARHFADASVPRLQFDASHVIWFATSNRADLLDSPLRSRFTLFDVEAPTKQQSHEIARRLYACLAANITQPPTVDDTVLAAVAHKSVRELQRALESALARAIRTGSSHVKLEHLRSESVTKHRLGFI